MSGALQVAAAVAAVAAVCAAGEAPPGGPCDITVPPEIQRFCAAGKFEDGAAYPKGGTGGQPVQTHSPQVCCCACAASDACNGFTLNHDGTCYLKSTAGPSTRVPSPSAVSAILPPRPPPPPYKPKYPTPKGAKNVLFLAVDDMRPSLEPYNFTLGSSPNIAKLAASGLLFKFAYVQYAFCSPSRNSFMSGRRPDTTKVWEFLDHFREKDVGATWVTLPEYHKQFGYTTLGGGKLYHPNMPPDNDFPLSWSPEHPYFPTPPPSGAVTCASQGPFETRPDQPFSAHSAWCAVNTDRDSTLLPDQQIRDNCINHLIIAKNASEAAAASETAEAAARPFFVGCGFHKPHAPYEAPKEFFDLIPAWENIPLPADPFAPVGMPVVAWHPYADVSGMDETPAFNGTVNHTRLAVYRRAYYAAIAYQDYNIGAVLDKLESLGLAESTVVVLFGDHGYQLGEHDTWAKMTNFELAVHIPLIIRAPWMPNSVGKQTSVLAEMVDVFPTLAELAGLPDPRVIDGSQGINGTSLAPVLADPTNTSIKSAAFSQFAKCDIGTDVKPEFWRNQTQMMGYSVRTDEWRYTAWFRFDNKTDVPGNEFGRVLLDQSLGTELYDHRGDTGMWLDWPGENRNLVNETEFADVVRELHARVVEYTQLK